MSDKEFNPLKEASKQANKDLKLTLCGGKTLREELETAASGCNQLYSIAWRAISKIARLEEDNKQLQDAKERLELGNIQVLDDNKRLREENMTIPNLLNEIELQLSEMRKAIERLEDVQQDIYRALDALRREAGAVATKIMEVEKLRKERQDWVKGTDR